MDIELDKLKLSGSLLKTILIETLRGKSLSRILRDYTLSQAELSGKVLDLGSGSDSPSYKKYLRCKEPFSIVYSDYYEEGPNLVKIDLEKPFEIENDSYDFVTCLSALEHIYNFKNVIRESYKILKKEGEFIGSTPFVHIFHPSPYDYFRYSHQALTRMF
ncbi:MAG: methyltransferase domain-containing protein, partial [Dehalococcoidia bacterium]|nr:methyltransferase domain-containing protein [Dehalococcoidia bacterium]